MDKVIISARDEFITALESLKEGIYYVDGKPNMSAFSEHGNEIIEKVIILAVEILPDVLYIKSSLQYHVEDALQSAQATLPIDEKMLANPDNHDDIFKKPEESNTSSQCVQELDISHTKIYESVRSWRNEDQKNEPFEIQNCLFKGRGDDTLILSADDNIKRMIGYAIIPIEEYTSIKPVIVSLERCVKAFREKYGAVLIRTPRPVSG